jgi:signal peptidase
MEWKKAGRRLGIGMLLIFVIVNFFMFATARWNDDRMPGFAKWRVLSVLTGSMSPEIEAGDMVVVASYGRDQPQIGDVISFWQNRAAGQVLTHRVVSRLENGYVQTKGDANVERDGGWTDPSLLIGKVVLVIPYAARLQEIFQKPAVLILATLIFIVSLLPVRQLQRGRKTNEVA